MSRAPATAKLNLALVVGGRLGDGKHEVTTVLQRVDVFDRISVQPAAATSVRGFADDTLVARALGRLAAEAGTPAAWRVGIDKRIPVAAGLGGGSSDAATALRLANETLPAPLARERLLELAAELGADVPFFLTAGPQLGEGDGTRLTPLELPQDFWIVLLLPAGERKPSTAAVYEQFDTRSGSDGYDDRRGRLLDALRAVERPRDLAALPHNDLADSRHAEAMRRAGAFRADVTGAGPVVYGLFMRRAQAEAARLALRPRGRTWLTVPAWYG